MEEKKVECPRCQQDWIKRIRLLALDRMAFYCSDCQGLWHEAADVAADTFVDYTTWMEAQGRAQPNDPTEVSFLGYLTRPD